MTNGLKSKKTFLVDIMGLTEPEAEKELKRIAEERNVTASAVDLLDMGGDE